MQYVIMGDTEKYKNVLVYVLGHRTKEEAEKRLKEFIENPTENEKRLLKGFRNFRLKEVEEKDCWWDKE